MRDDDIILEISVLVNASWALASLVLHPVRAGL